MTLWDKNYYYPHFTEEEVTCSVAISTMVKKNCPIRHEYVLECQFKNIEIVALKEFLSYIGIKFPMFLFIYSKWL